LIDCCCGGSGGNGNSCSNSGSSSGVGSTVSNYAVVAYAGVSGVFFSDW
jgi:hypothetical protein